MSINYPTSLDSLPNPTNTDLLENATLALDHDQQHSNANDAIEALEAKVGINGSAVTTSHDYKLSAVTGSAKALTSGTSTQSVTGLNLTNPTLTVGSDATGDMYYRNSSGALTRLPIGSSGQIIQVSSGGIPEYIANPSAADASTTVKGVSEIATTAEITAGTATGSTGAVLVVPASAVGTAGASKIVQFDGTGKYPAADGSAITNISGTAYTVNADETLNSYTTIQVPFSPIANNDMPGWTIAAGGTPYTINGAASYLRMFDGGSGAFAVSTKIIGSGSNDNYSPSQSKTLRYKQIVRVVDTTDRKGWGFCTSASNIHTAQTDVSNGEMRFILNGSTLYAQNANGTTATSTNISSGLTLTNWNTFEIVFTPTVDIKFYVNGTLKATHTTNLPTTGTILLAIGANANGRQVDAFHPTVSIQN